MGLSPFRNMPLPPQNAFCSSDLGVPYIISFLFPAFAMSCGGSVAETAETGCVRHGAAPGLFSQVTAAAPLPSYRHLALYTQCSMACSWNVSIWGGGKGIVLGGLWGIFYLLCFPVGIGL